MRIGPAFIAAGLACVALVGCDPGELADSALQKAASSVVFPVVNIDMPAGPAQAATDCILGAASPDEVQLLARDVGVEAGTSTKAAIRAIAVRPEAQSCFAANGVPPVL